MDATRQAADIARGAVALLAKVVAAPRVVLEVALPDAPAVFVANHTSNADTVVLWTCLPPDTRRATRPVAAADYWLTSPLRRFFGEDVFNILPVERDPERRQSDPVEDMASALDAGSSLILFPEGRRNPGDAPLLPLKSGIYHLACSRPQVPVVPIWIENVSGVMPRGEVIPVPLLCTLHFGAPLAVGADEAKEGFLDRLRIALLRLAPPERDA